MSTRCNIHFNGWGETQANVYRHSDGYPDGVLPDLQKFFEAVEAQCGHDTRFDDPEYLAAKYVVWQSQQKYYAPEGKPLAFTGVSPCLQDHGDIEFVYTVDCDKLDQKGRPTVTHEEA